MISHAWTVVCEKAIIDRDTNNVVLDVVEQIAITAPEEFPRTEDGIMVFPAKTVVVSMWYREDPNVPEIGRARTGIIDPNGRELASSEIEVNVREYVRSRTRMASTQWPFTVDGNYIVTCDLQVDGEWQQVARVPLQLSFTVGQNE